MATLTYTADEIETRNEARLVSIHFVRHDLDGTLYVAGEVAVGHNDGSTFTEHERVRFSETRPIATVAAFFGAGVLATIEQKILELMQARGRLPGGTIT